VILTLDDLVGNWNGTQTIEYVEGDIDPEWAENNRYLETSCRIRSGADEYSFSGGWTYAGGLVLSPDGSFTATRQYTSNTDGSIIGTFTVDGTITNNGGRLAMNCRMEDVKYQSAHYNASKLLMTFNGVKEGTLTATFAPPAVTEEPVNFGTGQEKGRITFIQGRAFIHRNGRILPATVSESLMAGDLIVMDEGEVTIEGNGGGTLKFMGRTRFQLPEEVGVKKAPPSSISKIVGDIWTKTKELLRGESFEVKTPTGTCGVRG
jgi:hypothetical protein